MELDSEPGRDGRSFARAEPGKRFETTGTRYINSLPMVCSSRSRSDYFTALPPNPRLSTKGVELLIKTSEINDS